MHPRPQHAEPPSDSAPLGRTTRLLDEARSLVEQADREARDRVAELDRRTKGLQESLSEMEQLLVRTERQAAQLANLYVATYQLHASLEAGDVRAAVADIAVNLLGAERFSIWIKDDAGALVRAAESSGVDPAAPDEPYAGGDTLLDACVREQALQFGPREGSSSVASVPFAAQGELVGVLLVERILPQKPGFTAGDRELLDLLAAHTASALIAARAFQQTQRKLTTYEGLLGFLRGQTP